MTLALLGFTLLVVFNSVDFVLLLCGVIWYLLITIV